MEQKLFMVLLGCKPEGRHTEQHDMYFGIGDSLPSLLFSMRDFWKEASGNLHVDVWREVKVVDGYTIEVIEKEKPKNEKLKLFFVNLGGYKENDFEEYHYKQLVVAEHIAAAIAAAKETVFWKHHTSSHIDDKYGIDVDDVYEVEDLLSEDFRSHYSLSIRQTEISEADELHIGYLKFSKLEKGEV
ncbi:DUF1543 domain-containing protein [Sphingobacterium spiritivorum]|uniref:DUF1543 domain-containing protein n=1 Tax=Sphingobacterium spiritivorum TaxID=258 RepID=UPI001919B51C|nr:DUF1543 domain-containing protein [Sphingobacterium spiritivorum]QQT26326.1 DUF1543 domain-containing protein [Sphingobacterium spiritivorum]